MSDEIKPWYKQFWPWFLIALPMTAVIASMITINLAITDTDGLVKEDYYKEGLAVNADLAKKQMAEQLGITATGIHDRETGDITITFDNAAMGNYSTMKFEMIHPTRANNDVILILTSNNGMVFSGKLSNELLPGEWKIRIGPENDSWYILGRMLHPQNNRMNLH